MVAMHGNSPKTLRQKLLMQRKEFASGANYTQLSKSMQANLSAYLENEGKSLLSIALYWPIQDELDLRDTLIAWSQKTSGRQLALPVARPDQHLDFHLWQDGDKLTPSQHGVPEPDPLNPNRPAITPDCILIPCVGWSSSTLSGKTQYWRLGYGGGYFDRTLANLRDNNTDLICIGIAFDWQQLDDAQWTAKAHDEPLDMLLTESGLLR